jgi:hypothetical protein
MELKEFLRSFLPDYRERYENYNPDGFRPWDYDFIEEYFPEALQNFAKRISGVQRESDLRIIKALLPEHYTCELREKGVFCKSNTGIPDVWGNTEWQTFTERVKDIFGKRLMEIFHQVPPDHLSFTVYLEQLKIEEL